MVRKTTAAVLTAALMGAGTVALATAGPAAAATPTVSIVPNAKGAPVFSPSRVVVRTADGCNVTIHNAMTTSESLLYGTPGVWKMLPNGAIAAGAGGGVGVGVPMTAYFSLYDNRSAVLRVVCR
jgi:hypothetical protein